MAVELIGVGRDFATSGRPCVHALADVDLTITTGDAVALMGPSGSGKSTLLHLIGGLDRPSRGTVVVDGTDVGALSGHALADHRRSVGFVFQRFHLLPTLTVLDNVLTPTIGTRAGLRPEDRARELLELVGLGACAGVVPGALSAGEQQLVAVARALVNRPGIVLADEPTGSLDTATGFGVIDLLLGLSARLATTLLVATHDYAVAARMARIVTLRDGRIAGDRLLGPAAEPRLTAARIGSLGPLHG